jgi:hypothetical protein
MMEDPEIIQLNIQHYRTFLKLNHHTAETRQRATELLAEAQAQLPLAEAEVSSRKRLVAFCAPDRDRADPPSMRPSATGFPFYTLSEFPV